MKAHVGIGDVLDPRSVQILTYALRFHAHDKHAAYPQYDGYFDGWVLCMVTETVAFKGGTEFPAGRIVLAAPDVKVRPGLPVTRSAYDPDRGSVVAYPHEHIVPLSVD